MGLGREGWEGWDSVVVAELGVGAERTQEAAESQRLKGSREAAWNSWGQAVVPEVHRPQNPQGMQNYRFPTLPARVGF